MTKYSKSWAMPNRWTFQIKPIGEFVDRWLSGCVEIIDPFAGTSTRANHFNDLAQTGIKSQDWCKQLLLERGEGWADAVIFDPPYSPRQISECYKSVGIECTMRDTQNASWYSEMRRDLYLMLKPAGVALSFGWQSSGFGKKMGTEEIMLVQHGSAHNDTICVAQRKLPCLYQQEKAVCA